VCDIETPKIKKTTRVGRAAREEINFEFNILQIRKYIISQVIAT
jgi:hypothetical protein